MACYRDVKVKGKELLKQYAMRTYGGAVEIYVCLTSALVYAPAVLLPIG
jgi:hypothetical protein